MKYFLLFFLCLPLKASELEFLDIDYEVSYYNFEEVSSYLTPELEKAFDAFVFINSQTDLSPKSFEDPSIATCSGGDVEIPSQFAKIIWKKQKDSIVFERNNKNEIAGINQSNLQTIEGLDEAFSQHGQGLTKEVKNYLAKNTNKNLFPISSGNLPGNYRKAGTPSGLFNVDYNYTKRHINRTGQKNQFEAMPYTLLAKYTYGEKYNYSQFAIGIHGTPKNYLYCSKWHKGAGRWLSPSCPKCTDVKAGRTSLEAVESGAPGCLVKNNERSIGRWQDSAGCMRTITPAAKVIRDWAFTLESNSVPKLDYRYALPSRSEIYKPSKNINILFVVFEDYRNSCRAI